jgi:hypothetical protein
VATRPYGTWPSDLDADLVAGGSGRYFGLTDVSGDRLRWTEGRPYESGRTVVVEARPGAEPVDLTPAGTNARTGHTNTGAEPPTPRRHRLLLRVRRQPLYRVDGAGTEPQPITPEPPSRTPCATPTAASPPTLDDLLRPRASRGRRGAQRAVCPADGFVELRSSPAATISSWPPARPGRAPAGLACMGSPAHAPDGPTGGRSRLTVRSAVRGSSPRSGGAGDRSALVTRTAPPRSDRTGGEHLPRGRHSAHLLKVWDHFLPGCSACRATCSSTTAGRPHVTRSASESSSYWSLGAELKPTGLGDLVRVGVAFGRRQPSRSRRHPRRADDARLLRARLGRETSGSIDVELDPASISVPRAIEFRPETARRPTPLLPADEQPVRGPFGRRHRYA